MVKWLLKSVKLCTQPVVNQNFFLISYCKFFSPLRVGDPDFRHGEWHLFHPVSWLIFS